MVLIKYFEVLITRPWNNAQQKSSEYIIFAYEVQLSGRTKPAGILEQYAAEKVFVGSMLLYYMLSIG